MDSVSILSRGAWPVTTEASLPPAWFCNASHLSAQHVLMGAGWLHKSNLLRPGRALATESDAVTESQLADPATVLLGCIAFATFAVLNSVERVPLLPVGRTGSSLVGALLMVIFGVIPSDSVIAGLGKNLSLLALVWGSMVLGYALDKNGGLLHGLEAFCMWRPLGAWDSCMRLSLATSALAAFLGWDVGALMMSPVALKIAAQYPGQSAKPFLSAVATGANAGSILTPISNPGNVIVTLASGMPFATFVYKMSGPWALAVCINAAVVVVSYGDHFFVHCAPKHCSKDSDIVHSTSGAGVVCDSASSPAASLPKSSSKRADLESGAHEPQQHMEDSHDQQHLEAVCADADSIASGDAYSCAASPAAADSPTKESSDSHQKSAHDSQQGMETVHPDTDSATSPQIETDDSLPGVRPTRRMPAMFSQAAAWISASRQCWRGIFAYAVWATCLAFWFADVELGVVAICGGIALIMAEGTDAAEPVVQSADWPVIAYIGGILIVVPAFDLTGVMATLWDGLANAGVISVVEPEGLIMLVIVIALFTNIVTNVPAVLMLGVRVAALASKELETNEPLSADSSSAAMRGWLLVAFIAAMAGSFTVQGSITQVIAYSMGKGAEGGSVSFFEHLRVGVPATILTIAVGMPLLLAEEQM